MKKLLISLILVSLPLISWADKDGVGGATPATGESSLEGIIPGDGDLGTAIQEGKIELNHVPALIFYWIDYLTYIIGSLAVLMVIYGGLQYMIGSVSDEKERGKKSLMYALVGVFITFCSWMVIDWIQKWFTA